jgi:hypothetical protein
MRNFLLAGIAFLFLPTIAEARPFGAIAAGYAVDSDAASTAAGVGYGDSPMEAAKSAVDQCANQMTTVRVMCEVVSTFRCGGSGWVTTGVGRLDDGRSSAAWGTGPTPEDAKDQVIIKLKQLGDEDWHVKTPIGGATDDCGDE